MYEDLDVSVPFGEFIGEVSLDTVNMPKEIHVVNQGLEKIFIYTLTQTQKTISPAE